MHVSSGATWCPTASQPPCPPCWHSEVVQALTAAPSTSVVCLPRTAAPQQPQYVVRGQAPGPATVGASCVYVLRRADGHFYAGSTDALHDRIRAHRQVRPAP